MQIIQNLKSAGIALTVASIAPSPSYAVQLQERHSHQPIATLSPLSDDPAQLRNFSFDPKAVRCRRALNGDLIVRMEVISPKQAVIFNEARGKPKDFFAYTINRDGVPQEPGNRVVNGIAHGTAYGQAMGRVFYNVLKGDKCIL